MRIQTGQGTIPLITLIGIWSISALNALPGLAVSPNLRKTFCNLSAFHRTGHTDAFIASFPLDHPFYHPVGQTDGKDQ